MNSNNIKLLLFATSCIFLISCKKDYNTTTQQEVKNSENNKTEVNFASIGDSLISQSDFINGIEKSSDIKIQRINLSKIKYNYSKFPSWNYNDIEEKKIGNITLKFQKANIKKSNADVFVHINLSIYKDNKKIDSLTVYKEENYAEALVAVTQYYYIDTNLDLWTLEINEEEDGIKVIHWNQYKIDIQTGQIKLIRKSIDNNSNIVVNEAVVSWTGKYVFEKSNRDDLKTSFEILIIDLNSISIKYISNGEDPEMYKNLKGENVGDDKIKIIFNEKYENMGVIYIQKYESEYIISGDPIANINPGNDEFPLKKIK